MFPKLLRTTTRASSARFFSAVGDAAKKFHQENEAHLTELRKNGSRDPITFAYLRSRSYLSDAARKGQPEKDTPNEPQFFLKTRELELYPTPLDYTFHKGIQPSIARFNWPCDEPTEVMREDNPSRFDSSVYP